MAVSGCQSVARKYPWRFVKVEIPDSTPGNVVPRKGLGT